MMIKMAFWFACCALVAGCAGQKFSWQSPYKNVASLREGDILHIPTGVLVEKDQLINYLEGVKVVYVGESHDNINAHRVQLEILKALQDRSPGKVAVGMEMLKRSSQEAADQWVSGELGEKEWMRTWLDNWSNDFNYYRDILLYLREQEIPLIALRAPDDWLAMVKSDSDHPTTAEGSVSEEPRESLPEMDLQDVYHRSHIEAVFKKHPTTGQHGFDDFYKVQVLWDESMAQSVYEYLMSEQGQDKKMVVFAGAQHVEHGFGIPRRVFRRLPVPYAIVVPVTLAASSDEKPRAMGITLPDVPLFPGDFAWVVTHDDLKDEKVYLGVMIDSSDEGVKILGTTKGSVAETAGLQRDDIIRTFDGQKIETPFDLTYLIGQKKPGDPGVVEVVRGQETLRFEVTFRKGGFHF